MIQIETPFTAYELTMEELKAARTLGTEQRAYYQTLMTDAATERLSIETDPLNPLQHLQQEAYLKGQIDILNMLLADRSVVRPQKFKPDPDKAAVLQPNKGT